MLGWLHTLQVFVLNHWLVMVIEAYLICRNLCQIVLWRVFVLEKNDEVFFFFGRVWHQLGQLNEQKSLMLPSYVGVVINSIIRMPIKQSGVYGMQEIFSVAHFELSLWPLGNLNFWCPKICWDVDVLTGCALRKGEFLFRHPQKFNYKGSKKKINCPNFK